MEGGHGVELRNIFSDKIFMLINLISTDCPLICGSSRAFQKRIVLGVLEDVLGGLWTSVSVGEFLAGDVTTPVGGCTGPAPGAF